MPARSRRDFSPDACDSMPFNSLAYLLLLTVSAVSVAIAPWPAWVLIIASLFFYAVAGPFDTTVFLSAVALNWLIQICIPAGRGRIAAAAIVNIGLIGYFKYRNLLIGDASHAGSYIDTALPLGISFYSLQALAYHIDVSRGTTAPARSLSEFFLFKAFFPQLIAGPIVRAHQVLPQIQRFFNRRPRRLRLLSFGLGLIVLGLSRPSAAERHRVDLQRLQSKRPVAVSVGIGDPPDRHFGSGGSGRTRTGRHHDRTDAKVSPGDLKE